MIVVQSARSAATWSTARRFRKSITGRCSGAWPSGPHRSTAPSAFEYLAHAYRTLMSGRPGPVVRAAGHAHRARRVFGRTARRRRGRHPILPRWRARVGAARAVRPLVLVGGSRWTGKPAAALRAPENSGLPVACAFRHQGIYSTTVIRNTQVTSVSASIPNSPRACGMRTCCW